MKFACNKFRFLFFTAVIAGITFISCVKDPLTTDIKIVENVGKMTTVQMQMYSILDQLRKGFDERILPYGVKKQLIDSNVNEHSKTYLIDFKKGLLCGDYITRKGLLIYKHVVDATRDIDSVICDLNYSDFGILTVNGTMNIRGNYYIVKVSPVLDYVYSNISIMQDASLIVNGNQWVGVKRLLANPTLVSPDDGYQFDGGINNVLIRESFSNLYSFDVRVSECEKLPHAANFPEVGKLICESVPISNNFKQTNVVIDFDPLVDSKSDKMAKATHGNIEWFFEIQ
jgi:hypothetical protein